MLATTALLGLLASPAPTTSCTVLLAGHPLAWTVPQDTSAQLRRASELRDASGPDWKSGRYGAAAEKLKEALGIYCAVNAESGDPEGHYRERAITLRALVWNEFRAGESEAALEHYGALFDLSNDHADVLAERQSAYGAVFEHAGRLSTRAKAEAFWESVADIFEAYDDEERLAQLLLDRASSYATLGFLKEARADLAESIVAHGKIDDFDGANWGRNNLAFSYIGTSEWEKALEFLGDALAETRAGRGLAAQSALGYNLLTVASGVAQGGRPGRDVVESLWKIAEAEARDSKPAIVAPERLLVGALRVEVLRVGAARARGAVDRVKVAMPGAPGSLQADLGLHAAKTLLDGGEPRAALDELASLAIDAGPAFPHLRLRQLVLQAAAAAALEDRPDFDRFAEAASEAIASLDHDGTSRSAYEQLAASADAFPESRVGRKVNDEWSQLRRRGQRGGAGGSSLRGSNGPRVDGLAELGSQDPLFLLFAVDGELHVKDLLSGDEVSRPMDWKVRTVGFHGMTMELFGGYVEIVGVNYGSGAAAKGSPAGLVLNDLQNFRPLDASKALFVTRNGATFYGPVVSAPEFRGEVQK
ncbi:hypothetical protein Poly30_34040 [Planctomycetes bacterium Poly30]|uniref:Tetratricopeptide repeat protein n=1 Tax=Saltatorellus ferox TaxID=2528018 RepID=A0A518EUY1_9BACT|nr:hypothetical protein Poly30_34040 [Planctomycetes bacterium Poly30]